MRGLLIALGAVAFSALSNAAVYDSSVYAKLPQYEAAELSRKGTYLAVQVPDTTFDSEFSKSNLAILRLKDRKVVNVIRFAQAESVSSFFWDTDERLIIRTAEQKGSLADKIPKLNIYAINADGSAREVIYGPDVEAQASRASKKVADSGMWGSVVSSLREDPNHVLVAKIGISGGELVKVHTKHATQKKVTSFPGVGVRNVIVTPSGEPKFFVGTTTDLHTVVYQYTGNGWEQFADMSFYDQSLLPSVVSESGKVYFVGDKGGKTEGLFEWTGTGEPKLVYRHPVVDSRPIYNRKGELIASVAEAGAFNYEFFDTTSVEAQVLKAFVDGFPGSYVQLDSITDDGELALVRVASDRNWGDFFLYRTKTNRAEPLFNVAPWFDPTKLPTRTPIEVKARDGMVLHGYMTLPTDKEAKNLPLVVIPHGGPHGPRDSFIMDPEAAFLADHGYAVLQINFRGSGGYGPAFEKTGYRKWGLSMQDDITDATMWMVEQGIADKNRICISGASYGGYASLMGAVREPDLYKCAVSYVGVSDLPTMYSKGDTQRGDFGINVLKQYIGTDDADLKARSPSQHADKIKAKVLLVHGMEDERVPPAHYQIMKEALEKAGNKPELLIKSKEAHGFVAEANRKEYFDVLLQFLSKHIGN